MAAFPHSFLWGTATAAYQVGGGCDAGNKGSSIWNIYSHLPSITSEGTTGDVTVDHYHRFRENVVLMAEMGLRSYRFFISQPRLLPARRGEVNEAGVQFYSDLTDELLAYNTEPMITLYHWDLSQALQGEGGWEARTTAEASAEYAHLCYARFGSRVKLWVTFNETIAFIGYGYVNGLHPPAVCDPTHAIRACHHVFITHVLTVKAFREMNMADETGFINALRPHAPLTDSGADKKATGLADTIHTHWLYDPVLRGTYPATLLAQTQALWGVPRFAPDDGTLLRENRCDFVGLSYYRRETVSVRLPGIPTDGEPGVEGLFYFMHNPRSTYIEWEWEVQPQGLTDGIMMIKEHYGDILIYITKNGLGAKDPIIAGEVVDNLRIDYLSSHIGTLEKALVLRVDVRGYYPWSLVGLPSWLNGCQEQYGSVYIDHQQDLARKRKRSFHWYRSVIASHDEQR